LKEKKNKNREETTVRRTFICCCTWPNCLWCHWLGRCATFHRAERHLLGTSDFIPHRWVPNESGHSFSNTYKNLYRSLFLMVAESFLITWNDEIKNASNSKRFPIRFHGTGLAADERNRKELLKTVPDESALRKLN
jgi:hypothetical protein